MKKCSFTSSDSSPQRSRLNYQRITDHVNLRFVICLRCVLITYFLLLISHWVCSKKEDLQMKVFFMAPPVGLEPTTHGLTVRRSTD